MGEIADAIDRLRSAQKPNRGAPAYSRFVNRPFGRVLAALAFRLRMSPNGVTVVSALFTLSGVALLYFVPPSISMSLLLVALLVLGYALDSADGQLARLQGGGSARGEWLDHMADATKMASIHLGVLVSWFRFSDLPNILMIAPIVFQIAASVFFFGVILTELLGRATGTSTTSSSTVGNSPLYALAVLPADYGLLILVFLILWWIPGFVVVYSILALLNVLILLVSLVRWYRRFPSPRAEQA